jgi:1,4-dihydroxy-2-naphthoate octaprenyltransferase
METRVALGKLSAYPYTTVFWRDDEGRPMSVPVTDFAVDTDRGHVTLARPAGAVVRVPADREIGLISGHIRRQPGIGYDERRYVELWGRMRVEGERLVFEPRTAWGWDEAELPFMEYSERGVEQAIRYFGGLSARFGRPMRPRLQIGWLLFRATRLPFLSATLVPVLLGLAIAARDGAFQPVTALLTVIAAAAVHLGLNVSNDVFDDLLGADRLNYTPTPYSGGSRVIQYGLLTRREMAALSAALYGLAILIGLGLVAWTRSVELLLIGILGVVISLGYTAPPLKLVYRGLGEFAVALGFGPVMLLGAYVVQTGHVALEPLVASLPVAIFVALILYVNEIPDRVADAAAGKRTLVVRFSPETVRAAYLLAALTAFAVLLAGVAAGLLPIPTLIALAALPLALKVYRGIGQTSNAYGLMAVMATNIKLHLVAGALLLAGYLVAIGATLVSVARA